MDRKNVSIIIPVYNAEKFINKTLNSIKKQTYKYFEVILVNDGSTDNSRKICERFMLEDDRFKLFNKKNSGVSATRNFGLDQAQGEYILFIDADDYVSPKYIENLVTLTNEFDYIICGHRLIDGDTFIDRTIGENDLIVDSHKEIVNLILTNKSVFSFPWGRVFNREILIKNNIKFPNNILYGEDLIFNLQYISEIDSMYIIASTDYNYVKNAASASGKLDSINKFTSRLTDLDAIQLSIEMIPNEYKEEITFLKNRFVKEASSYYVVSHNYKTLDPNEIKNRIIPYLVEFYNSKEITFIEKVKVSMKMKFPKIMKRFKK